MDSFKLKQLEGLAFEKYPKDYKDYILEEEKQILKLIEGTKRLLDVGCGSNFSIYEIAKKVKEYVGIDQDSSMLYEAKDKTSKLKNCKIQKLDVHQLSKNYPENYFDDAIAVLNALGCMGDELHWLNEVSKVTKNRIILSLVEKGHLEKRIKYYEDLNSSYIVMTDGKETISSPLWGYSRAFSKEDIENYAKQTGLKVDQYTQLAKIGLLVVLKKT